MLNGKYLATLLFRSLKTNQMFQQHFPNIIVAETLVDSLQKKREILKCTINGKFKRFIL